MGILQDKLVTGPKKDEEQAEVLKKRFPLLETFAERAEAAGLTKVAESLRASTDPSIRVEDAPGRTVERFVQTSVAALGNLVDTDRWSKATDPRWGEDTATQIVLFESGQSDENKVVHGAIDAIIGILGETDRSRLSELAPVDPSQQNTTLFRGHEPMRDMRVASIPLEVPGSPFDTTLELAIGTGQESGLEHYQLTAREVLPKPLVS